MNLIYGALLLHSAGKEINEGSIKKVVEATGEKIEETQIKALVAALDGVDIKSAIEKAAMPVAVAAPVEAKAAKKEEVKEEDREAKAQEAAAGLGALFG